MKNILYEKIYINIILRRYMIIIILLKKKYVLIIIIGLERGEIKNVKRLSVVKERKRGGGGVDWKVE